MGKRSSIFITIIFSSFLICFKYKIKTDRTWNDDNIFFKKKNLISFHIALEKREAVCSFMWGHVSFKEAGMGMAFRETTAPFFPELPFPKPLLPQANLAQLSIPFHCSLYLYFTPRSLSFSPATGLFKKDENYWVLFRIGWCEKNIH